MGCKIIYTCNWCLKTTETETTKTPNGWVEASVHNPDTMGLSPGTFCDAACQEKHEHAEPVAIKAAQDDYTQKFWSQMNELRTAK